MVVIDLDICSPPLVVDEVHSRRQAGLGGNGTLVAASAHGASGAAMMAAMRCRSARPAPAPTAPPSTRSVLLRYALGTAVATIVIVVGGYFVLRSVAIDEAKRETRTKVVESGQLVESELADGRR